MARLPDPRTIITPTAFEVAPKLLNRPLASPWRRGLALMLDLLMVVMLAELPLELLWAILLAVGWVRWRGIKVKAKMQTGIYLALGLWLLFTMVFNASTDYPQQSPPPRIEIQTDNEALAQICDAEDQALCTLKLASDLMAKVVTGELSTEQEMTAYLIMAYGLPDEAAAEVAADLLDGYQGSLNEVGVTVSAPDPGAESADEQGESKAPASRPQIAPLDEATALSDEEEGWREGLKAIEDLVDGFVTELGWASVYFTVLTAWFHGQTLGKKVFGIRVIQLDNTPISLWEAFGRYGGYGAGIATGMMGFVQMFWDPNRQAIQDKISSTVVVDLRAKARRRARAVRKQMATNHKEQ
ncbi:RDD family protein [Ferrimonas sediminum]|uniref:RDD family protein n=1 Tax=Ferrimonas sediminum TaxID=718193 RepID=A0A1G8TVD4_9GAMM|nr:RDD family protein [Ferrimonas sediminum]SDJ45459.1 RDD family protein [Ferrimonas sediminum]